MKRTEPLRMNYMFRRLYARGKAIPGRHMVLYILENRKGKNRLGITASRKVGKSVKRNRVRRIIKESYRHLEEKIGAGYDMVFVARAAGIQPGFWEVKKEMGYLLERAGVFAKENET